MNAVLNDISKEDLLPTGTDRESNARNAVIELTDEECALVSGGRSRDGGRDPEVPVVTDCI